MNRDTNILSGGVQYLREFHNYWNLSKINSYPEPIKDIINYFFGVDKKHLTKDNLQNKEKFVQVVLDNQKKSELEEDLEAEINYFYNHLSA